MYQSPLAFVFDGAHFLAIRFDVPNMKVSAFKEAGCTIFLVSGKDPGLRKLILMMLEMGRAYAHMPAEHRS